MKVVIIHGQNHKGSTYHIAHMVAEKSAGHDGQITEFFLPRDFGEFCLGCKNCFNESETKCPHYEKLNPITTAINQSDLIILASPVYAFHATGAMKVFLDHYAYRWLVHRPEGSMFTRQGICISTAAGSGMKSTIKDMMDSLFFWGVAKRYKYGKAVMAVDWEGVSAKIKKSIDKKTSALAKKIIRREGKVKPGLKTKGLFYTMHLLQRNGFNPRDVQHWKSQGWTEKVRPWKCEKNK